MSLICSASSLVPETSKTQMTTTSHEKDDTIVTMTVKKMMSLLPNISRSSVYTYMKGWNVGLVILITVDKNGQSGTRVLFNFN